MLFFQFRKYLTEIKVDGLTRRFERQWNGALTEEAEILLRSDVSLQQNIVYEVSVGMVHGVQIFVQ